MSCCNLNTVTPNLQTSQVSMPAMGLGVYLIPPLMTKDLVFQALQCGYRLFDTAQIYKNEQEVSEGVRQWILLDPGLNKRSDVYIISKIWDSLQGSANTKKSLKLSIRKMCLPGVDYIDLFLIHSPNTNRTLRLETYDGLQAAKESGYVKNIGVSNYGIHHLQELFEWLGLKYPPVVNQLELHPWLMRTELVEYCRRHDIVCQAYSPLSKARKFNDEILNSVAKKYNKTNAQVLLRWLIQHQFVPILKTMHPDRLVSNAKVWDFELSPEDIRSLEFTLDYFITGWDPTLYRG